MSVTTLVPSRLKASEGRRIAPRKSALLGQVLADGGVLLVEREMAGDQGEDAAGLQCVDRLGEEEIVQRQLLAAVVELDVGERHVADHGVDAPSGRRVSRKFSMRMSGSGWSAGRCGRRCCPARRR